MKHERAIYPLPHSTLIKSLRRPHLGGRPLRRPHLGGYTQWGRPDDFMSPYLRECGISVAGRDRDGARLVLGGRAPSRSPAYPKIVCAAKRIIPTKRF